MGKRRCVALPAELALSLPVPLSRMATAERPIPPSPQGFYERGTSFIFHRVSQKQAPDSSDADFDTYWAERELSTQRFFERIPPISLTGKTLIDVGCGLGNTCIEAARRGAERVLGVDIDAERIEFAQRHVQKVAPEQATKVTFQNIESLKDLRSERFDLVLSQDSFEHLDDPEGAVHDFRTLLSPGGVLIIGFGPLWGSPWGGHLNHITSVPYAHLIFPERVVMHERMRFRPDERAHTYEECRGGLNRMTIARFERIMAATGMECISYETNAGDNKVVRAMSLLALIPVRRELWRHLFTANVYGAWREPQPGTA